MSEAPDGPTGPAGPAEPAPLARRGRVSGDQIVAVAAELFARDGYHAVGMRDIADALGIRGASLYHHHGSKEEILFAIGRTVTEEPVRENLPLLDAPGSPATRLAALVRAHLRHLVARRVEYLVGLHELAALTPEHRAVVTEHRRYYFRRVREVIAAGVRAGELTVDDPRLAAFALLDTLNGIAVWYRADGPQTVDEIADGYVRLLVGGLLGAGMLPGASGTIGRTGDETPEDGATTA